MKVFTVIGIIAVAAALAFPIAILGGLPLMLALGICHHQWPQVPAFGFWASVALLWALRVVVPYPSKTATTDS